MKILQQISMECKHKTQLCVDGIVLDLLISS